MIEINTMLMAVTKRVQLGGYEIVEALIKDQDSHDCQSIELVVMKEENEVFIGFLYVPTPCYFDGPKMVVEAIDNYKKEAV